MAYTTKDLERLSLIERVDIINELLEESSLKKLLESHVMIKKAKLKELLKPYEYNHETRQFELLDVVESSINEQQIEVEQDQTVALLGDIKEILLQMSDKMTTTSSHPTIVSDSRLSIVKSNGDKLVTRSFKIYEKINDRLKQATKESDLTQQQIFNSLLDKALRELGY